jgi:hypothetical protein
MSPFGLIVGRFTLLFLALVGTSAYWQRAAIFGAILLLDLNIFNALRDPPSYFVSGLRYLLGVAVFAMDISAANMLVFIKDPQITIRRVNKPPTATCLKTKLQWAHIIVSSPRLVGTTLAVPHLRPPPSFGLRDFIIQKIYAISLHTVIVVMGCAILGYFNLVEYMQPDTPLSPLWRECARRLVVAIGGTFVGFSVINGVYDIIAVLYVLCGSQPQDWPDLFGSMRDATTVGKAWG